MDDTLWTIDEVLWRLPWWIAQDFNCTRGPHTWRSVETCGVWAPLTEYQFCLHCPAKRRHQEVA